METEKKKKYSVLLLYPDYVATEYGETVYDFVEASDPMRAGYVAQENACMANEVELENIYDFKILLITEGYNMDHSEEY